jgi:hypothetical protein
VHPLDSILIVSDPCTGIQHPLNSDSSVKLSAVDFKVKAYSFPILCLVWLCLSSNRLDLKIHSRQFDGRVGILDSILIVSDPCTGIQHPLNSDSSVKLSAVDFKVPYGIRAP